MHSSIRIRQLAVSILCMLPLASYSASSSARLTVTATILPSPAQQLRDDGQVHIQDENGNVYRLDADQRFRFARDPQSVIREILPSRKGQGPLRIDILY